MFTTVRDYGLDYGVTTNDANALIEEMANIMVVMRKSGKKWNEYDKVFTAVTRYINEQTGMDTKDIVVAIYRKEEEILFA